MLSDVVLKQTPLYEEHLALKAKMIPFGGWDMPLQYEGILKEYQETRQSVSVFDTSHMGEFIIEGDVQKTGMDRILIQPLKDMPIKSCRYGAMLNSEGGVMDDLIVYRLATEKWMIVVNGATMEKDANHFLKNLTDQAVFTNISFQTGKLDVQGPQSRKILSSLIEEIEKLDYYTFDEFILLGEKVIISRTGYTGELGYEIYFPWERLRELWKEILKKKIKPAGLGARDALRIEMGYSLYGHELDESILALESGLKKFIDWQKDFIGKAALLKAEGQGLKRRIVCFIGENRRTPRQNYKIFSPQDEEIGVVTSGTFSPNLERGIGLGFITHEFAKAGQMVSVGDEKNKFKVRIMSRSIYKNGSLRS